MTVKYRKFKVGDKVKSGPKSGDMVYMKSEWRAVISKFIADNEDGGCYETVGRWKDGDYDVVRTGNTTGQIHWTSRQLWGSHLVRRQGEI